MRSKACVIKKVTTPPVLCNIEGIKLNRHEIAIDALASGESVTNAALRAGITRQTLSRWLHNNPVFIAKLNEKKNEVRNEAIASINSIVSQSAAALKVALRHPDINPTAVVQSIMSMLPKMYAAMLEQGEAETSPVNVLLNLYHSETKGRVTFDDAETAGVMLNKYVEAHKAVMEWDQVNDSEESTQEMRDRYKEKVLEIVNGL